MPLVIKDEYLKDKPKGFREESVGDLESSQRVRSVNARPYCSRSGDETKLSSIHFGTGSVPLDTNGKGKVFRST